MNIIDNKLDLIYSEAKTIHQRLAFAKQIKPGYSKALLTHPLYQNVQDSFSLIDREVKLLSRQDPNCRAIKKCWKQTFKEQTPEAMRQFCETVAPLTRCVPIGPEFPFANTDLVVFKNDYRGPLPPNGVFEKDFAFLSALLFKIAGGNTNVTIDPACTADQRRLLVDSFAKLLTRPTSRELVLSLVGRKNQKPALTIRPDKYSYFEHAHHSIGLTFTPSTPISEARDGKRYSETMPIEFTLAHELIHFRHALDGTRIMDKDRLSHKNQVDGEEQRTIIGRYRGIKDDRINDRQIRLEFGYFPRWGHRAGANPSFNRVEKGLYAIRNSITGDFLEFSDVPAFQNYEAHASVLSYAIDQNNPEMIALIYPRYKAILAAQNLSFEEQCSQVDCHPLESACRAKKFKVFERILSVDGNDQFINAAKKTCLHLSIHSPKKTEWLLQRGANPDSTDENGRTAFDDLMDTNMDAAAKLQSIRLFLDAGATHIPEQALFCAIAAQDDELVEQLLDAGVSLECLDRNGHTPLLTAIANGQTELAGQLLHRGANLFACNNDNRTALALACEADNEELFAAIHEAYVQRGAALPPRSNSLESLQARTHLVHGTDAEFKTALDDLLAAGETVNFMMESGHSLLSLALSEGVSVQKVIDLLAAGADMGAIHPVTGQAPYQSIAGTQNPLHANILMAQMARQTLPLHIHELVSSNPPGSLLNALDGYAIHIPDALVLTLEPIFASLDPASFSLTVQNVLAAQMDYPHAFQTLGQPLCRIALERGQPDAIEVFRRAGFVPPAEVPSLAPQPLTRGITA